MTVLVRESGMLMTVSSNSPSTNVRTLDLETQPDDSAVAVSRSATVTPT
jgi:hypothetical protein